MFVYVSFTQGISSHLTLGLPVVASVVATWSSANYHVQSILSEGENITSSSDDALNQAKSNIVSNQQTCTHDVYTILFFSKSL